MPRVTHVKKAQKDNPVAKKGESYYWWKFRYGGKRYSLKRPRPSQLTQSAYYGTVRALVEQIEDADNFTNNEDLESFRDEIASELEQLGSECQESLDNMPESLQYSPTGELLQERIDACEEAQSEVECVDEFDGEEDEFEREEFEREEFESVEFDPTLHGYDSKKERDEAEEKHNEEQEDEESEHDAEQNDAENDHNEEQDDLETAHNEEREAALETWAEEAKDAILEAVASCEV